MELITIITEEEAEEFRKDLALPEPGRVPKPVEKNEDSKGSTEKRSTDLLD